MVDNMKQYLHIFGPRMSTIQGKTVRKKANQLVPLPDVPIPSGILEKNNHVVIFGDVFYVQKIPIIHTISNPFQLRTV